MSRSRESARSRRAALIGRLFITIVTEKVFLRFAIVFVIAP